MDYTISQLAKLANISTRTLRYYDEINLLKPASTNNSGYRIYGQKEVDLLQQILFYKELDVELGTISSIINDPTFNKTAALEEHHQKLVQKRSHINQLIETVEKTIAHEKGEIKMNDQEKFNGFKEQLINENDTTYGKEIREAYGNHIINESNSKFRGMSKEDFEEMEKLGNEILDILPIAFNTGDPSSSLGRELASKHKAWLMYSWPSYSKEAHASLAEMYVADERFKAYYEKNVTGGAEFLRDAILNFLKEN